MTAFQNIARVFIYASCSAQIIEITEVSDDERSDSAFAVVGFATSRGDLSADSSLFLI